jgi:hypothetical protein
MNVKADDLAHHRVWDHKNRDLLGDPAQERLEAPEALLRDQHRLDWETPARERGVEHDLAFEDKSSAPPDEVSLSNIAIGLEARVVEVFDEDLHRLSSEALEECRGPRRCRSSSATTR